MAGTADLLNLPAHSQIYPPNIHYLQDRIYPVPHRQIRTSQSFDKELSAYDPTPKECDLDATESQVMTDHVANSRPPYFSNWAQEWAFVFTVMLSSSATTVLQGVILIMTETIGKSLNATSSQVTWVAAAVGLGSGSFMLLLGKVADELGRKMQLLIGLLLMSAFSLLAAWTPGPIELIVICGFLGVCTAAIAPPAVGILFAAYPEGPRRNMACGALGTGNPLGFILGSVSSGLAVKYSGWKASFIVQAIFFLLMVVLAYWTVPTIPRQGNNENAFKQFDYAGSIFIVLGVALISSGLTEGPQSGWLSVHVVLLLIFGVFFILGFVVWEYFYQYPLLDLSVWRNVNFTLCVICMAFGYGSFITNEFWIALYMQDVQHFAPLHIAARMLPQAVAGVFWSFLGQWLVQKIHGTIVMGIGSLMYLVGAVLLLFIKEDTSYWVFLFPALVITVVGADFQFIVANLYTNKQMPTQASLGVGIIQTAYRLSITFGLAITSAVFNIASSSDTSISNPTITYQRVYICSIVFAAISLALVPFMRIQTCIDDTILGSTPPTTTVSEISSSMYATANGSSRHSNFHQANPYFSRSQHFVPRDLNRTLNPTHPFLPTRPPPTSPLNLPLNITPQIYREALNTQRYEPTLPRARTMNDITQGLLRLPRWSWENRPGKGFWRNRRGSQCHWESNNGDLWEVCKKCKEERKIVDEGESWKESEGDVGERAEMKEGAGRRGTRVMEVEFRDERRFTV